jgi:hypothetical protein
MLKIGRVLALGCIACLAALLASTVGSANRNEGPRRDRRLFVFDGTGAAIGLYAGTAGAQAAQSATEDGRDFEGRGAAYRIYLEPLDVSILVNPSDGELVVLSRSFTSANCQGEGLYGAASAGIVTRDLNPADTSLYLAATDVLVEDAVILSRMVTFAGGFCSNEIPDPATNLVPAVPFTEDLGLSFPLRLPLRIGTRSP